MKSAIQIYLTWLYSVLCNILRFIFYQNYPNIAIQSYYYQSMWSEQVILPLLPSMAIPAQQTEVYYWEISHYLSGLCFSSAWSVHDWSVWAVNDRADSERAAQTRNGTLSRERSSVLTHTHTHTRSGKDRSWKLREKETWSPNTEGWDGIFSAFSIAAATGSQ